MSKRKTTNKKAEHFAVPKPSKDGGSSSSSSSSLKDFLGMGPSPQPSLTSGSQSSADESGQDEEEVTGSEDASGGTDDDAGNDDNNDNDDADDANADNRTSGDSPSSTEQPDNRHSKRKQNRPKKHQNRASKEIKRLQKSTNLLIPRLPFQRVVREVLQNVSSNELRLQSTALDCLRESTEAYLVNLFEDAALCCLHRQRVTVDSKDMRLVRVIRGPSDPGRH